MKVEQTKCPNCGASIEYNINLKKQQITCNYCGTNFYVLHSYNFIFG